jgi:hypothetical protein
MQGDHNHFKSDRASLSPAAEIKSKVLKKPAG